MTMTRFARRSRALLLLTPVLAALCGCGGAATASRPADPDRARQALRAGTDGRGRGHERRHYPPSRTPTSGAVQPTSGASTSAWASSTDGSWGGGR